MRFIIREQEYEKLIYDINDLVNGYLVGYIDVLEKDIESNTLKAIDIKTVGSKEMDRIEEAIIKAGGDTSLKLYLKI